MGLSDNPAPNSAMNLEVDFSSISVRAQAILEALIALYAVKPFFDIRDYGAVVDGVTDDSAALLAAVQAAKALGGGVIYFPRGTTRLTAGINYDVGTVSDRGQYIFFGEAGASKIRATGLGANQGIALQGANIVLFRDLAFVGSVSGAFSAPTVDGDNSLIITGNCDRTIVQNCVFAGWATNGGHVAQGVVAAYGGKLAIRDSIFGACSSLATGVVNGWTSHGLEMDNVLFMDFLQFDDVYYNKISLVGDAFTWVQTSSSPDPVGAPHCPELLSVKNCSFDEGIADACITAAGHAERSALIENSMFASGHGGNPGLNLSTFRKVTVKGSQIGLSLNTVEHEAMSFTDVDQIELDNVNCRYGAQYTSLLGTTKRLRARNTSFNGGVTHPLGVNNSAGAFCDLDSVMPTTASAAALVPKGKVTHVTGTTNITSITATNFKPGDVIRLIFDDVLTVTDGNNLSLAGNFVTAAGDNLVLAFDGTNFVEQSRSVN